MNDYAVIKTGGKQYQVSPGDKLEIEKLDAKEGEEIKFSEVLLKKLGEKLNVGKPFLKGETVKAKVLSQKRGDKIRVAKFKAKSRYRKVKGHRQALTEVEILPFSKK